MLFAKRYLVGIFILMPSVLLASIPVRDTVTLTISEAEKRFLANNLDLIISRYDIDRAKAGIITARLFDNPELSFENALYNPETKKFFQSSYPDGQYSAQLSQLITLAGKRNKNIQLAKTDARMAEARFYDLLRTLRYTLRTDFYKLYYQQQTADVYVRQIESLKEILAAFRQQYSKGNIALKDLLRIQSMLYSLQSEYNEALAALEDTQAELRQLVGIAPPACIQASCQPDFDHIPSLTGISYQALVDSAMLHRPDMQLVKLNLQYARANLNLQKASAVPDITLSLTTDLQGSYIKHYTGIGISLPLPLFNRNQGAIKQARIDADAGSIQEQKQQQLIENEVSGSYLNAVRMQQAYEGIDKNFNDDYNRLIAEVGRSYQKRTISLLEFLDFYDSYKENAIQFNTTRLNYLTSLENINYVTGNSSFNR
ncbi:TolC family protein [Pedobacter sp. BS3]|uniref:TolC family protein n=1 Tax=Pedobacter sp. BS3 TaxID=2567937 RepID=UPI0011EF7C2D|nr:TolC family protein [Pedobacter sp. BS3]TZF83614.1 TolC family protein [Pedobacter sp. BS3]